MHRLNNTTRLIWYYTDDPTTDPKTDTTLLVGANGPVVRSAIMGTLALIARQIGRRAHGLNGLDLQRHVLGVPLMCVSWAAMWFGPVTSMNVDESAGSGVTFRRLGISWWAGI